MYPNNLRFSLPIKYFIPLFVFIHLFSNSKAQSSLNEKLLSGGDSISEYSFFVSGHFHGSSQNTSGKPAKTLLGNISRINNQRVKFLICLGDLFMDIKNDIPTYKKTLLDKLNMPVFNSPGNHDKSGSIYEEHFGKTYYYFIYASEMYIILDTELNDGSIEGDQLDLFKKALEAAKEKKCKNIFIFTHRLIWAEEHPEMKNLFTDNTRSNGGNNFRNEILPLLESNSKDINVFLLGGSLGSAPAPFFYHQEKNITYIATAIRDTSKDALLLVKVNQGKVMFTAFPLVMPIEFYNLDYYEGSKKPGQQFNWRLVPLYIKTMVMHRFFWYGILWISIPTLIYLLVRSIKKRRLKN